jgi:hypothetical protein
MAAVMRVSKNLIARISIRALDRLDCGLGYRLAAPRRMVLNTTVTERSRFMRL